MFHQRFVIPIYLLSLFFIGLGYIAILPAFEGFDEPSHYSSIRQIADIGTIPIYGKSFLDQEYANYQGPLPYTSLTPPFDQGMTYSKFFASSDSAINYILSYRQSSQPSLYKPSTEQNEESQHPPLYYILMAPIEKGLESFSLITRIFVLRLASYVIVLAGIFMGIKASRTPGLPIKSDPSLIGWLLYPIALPMFFPEFTRIGNDSLCIFLVGLIALLVSKWLKDKNNRELSLIIGGILGLGLLTKAFFLPIIVALGIFLSLNVLRDKRQPTNQSKHWQNLFLLFSIAILIGGGWYAYKFIEYGTLIGSADSIHLSKQGGLAANLKQNFSLYGLVRGLIVTPVTYSWAGTWSLTRLPALFQLPLLGLATWGFVAFIMQLRIRPLTDSAWLPVLLFVIFGAGFFYHVVISVAINGNGNTPGWYLHILMPWVAPALGVGFLSLFKNHTAKPFLIGLLFYAIVFQAVSLWAQFALFTGCATKGDNKYYVFSDNTLCLDQASVLFNRLSALGYPYLAIMCFGGGLFCALLLMVLRKNKAKVAVLFTVHQTQNQ